MKLVISYIKTTSNGVKPYYSKKIIEHFLHPKNFGKIKDANGIGKVGNPRCGDIMELFIKVERKGKEEIIKDIKFSTMGCAAAIATSDMICEMVKGKTLGEALKVGYEDIIDKTGPIPSIKVHCAQLARAGMKAAIDDYKRKSQK